MQCDWKMILNAKESSVADNIKSYLKYIPWILPFVIVVESSNYCVRMFIAH